MTATNLNSFEKLADTLKGWGYKVERTDQMQNAERYTYWKVSGNNLIGGFCSSSKQTYKHIKGHFAADHVGCFDKWSKCPLVVRITASMDFQKLKIQLDFLSSDAGKEFSGTFGYLDDKTKLQRDVI